MILDRFEDCSLISNFQPIVMPLLQFPPQNGFGYFRHVTITGHDRTTPLPLDRVMSAKIGVWGGVKYLLQWGLSPRVLEIPSHSLSTCIHIH